MFCVGSSDFFWVIGVVPSNVVAGRNAPQFNVAEQDNITRRIVALHVFGGVHVQRSVYSVKFLGSPLG